MLRYEDHFPRAEDLLRLPVEQLALPGLLYLSARERDPSRPVHISGLANKHNEDLRRFAGAQLDAVAGVMAEVWAWLVARGMLAPDPEQLSSGWHHITRRGREWLRADNPNRWLAASLLPERELDAQLAAEVIPRFIAGQLDSAVRDAFRRVEVRVREKSGLGDGPTAVPLMHAAFTVDPTRPGPLVAGRTRTTAEFEGERDMFVGAMKRFRNPNTHGDTGLDDPVEAVELILYANLLLRMLRRALVEQGRP